MKNPKEIIIGNEIITNFLGQHVYGDCYEVENHEYPDSSSFFDNATDCLYHKENLLYHCNWDWLMDAIEKIKEMDASFCVDPNLDILSSFFFVVDCVSKKYNKTIV